MVRSEATAKSLVRFSEKIDPDTMPPLVELDDVKTYFGITDTTLDSKLTMATTIVSSLIRGYCGRMFSSGIYTETFTDVLGCVPERYLLEIPISQISSSPSESTLLNRRTGRVVLTGGPTLVVEYEGGYDELPADLMGVAMELIRQQMAAFGVDQLGISNGIGTPPERAVWVGTLKVEYAVGQNSTSVKATGNGALPADALAPYAYILDSHRSYRMWAAT